VTSVHQNHVRNNNYMQNFDIAISGTQVVHVNLQQKALSMRDMFSQCAFLLVHPTPSWWRLMWTSEIQGYSKWL